MCCVGNTTLPSSPHVTTSPTPALHPSLHSHIHIQETKLEKGEEKRREKEGRRRRREERKEEEGEEERGGHPQLEHTGEQLHHVVVDLTEVRGEALRCLLQPQA
jgi:hypothetical protein